MIRRQHVALALLTPLALVAGLTLTPELAAAADPPTMKGQWSVKVGADAGPQFLAVTGKRLIVVSWDGEIVGLATASGKQRWRKKPPKPGTVDRVSVSVGEGRVVAAWPETREVIGYGASYGKEKWKVDLGGAHSGLVGCKNHRAAVVTHRGGGTLKATALDPKDGSTLWSVPAPGPVVGAGGDYVFASTPSGFGIWPGSLTAIHCATGAIKPLRSNGRKVMTFLSADQSSVATRQFDPGFKGEQICLQTIEGAEAPTCFAATDGSVPAMHVNGATLVDGTLYFSTARMEARNLNPNPDAWLFARRADGVFTWRSPHSVSNGAPVFANSLLVTGFGTTGAKDALYYVDYSKGTLLAKMDLRKAPQAIAVDAEKAYVATYDGTVRAAALIYDGPPETRRQPVQRQDIAAAPPPSPGSWRLVRTIDAHPKKARTSGSKVDGSADPVAFVDPAGAEIVVGGNDDKVRVFDVASGKRRWISKKLGKDVEYVQVGFKRMHARIYGGKSFIFERKAKGDGWKRLHRIEHPMGWMSGLIDNGRIMVADDFDGTFSLYDTNTGAKLGDFSSPGSFDRRGTRVRGSLLITQSGSSLGTWDLSRINKANGTPLPGKRVLTPNSAHGGKLVQAWFVGDGVLLREYCGPTQCVVEFVHVDEGVQRTITFDTRGAGWVPTVPSTLDVTPAGDALFFFRLGIDPVIVELVGDKEIRTGLQAITGQAPGEYTAGAFSADGKRLVLGMYPKSYQATVIERR